MVILIKGTNGEKEVKKSIVIQPGAPQNSVRTGM